MLFSTPNEVLSDSFLTFHEIKALLVFLAAAKLTRLKTESEFSRKTTLNLFVPKVAGLFLSILNLQIESVLRLRESPVKASFNHTSYSGGRFKSCVLSIWEAPEFAASVNNDTTSGCKPG